jgi:predicted PurR-regulated permease PerM
VDPTDLVDRERNRIAWWLYLGVLGLGVAFLAYSFVGTFALGLFVYYASRPVFHRLRNHLDGRGLAAGATLVGFVAPILLVIAYVIVEALRSLASLSNAESGAVDDLLAPVVDVEALTGGQQNVSELLSSVPGSLQSLPMGGAEALLTSGLAVLAAAAGVLVHVSLAFAFAFFLLRDGDRIETWFRNSVAGEGTAGHAYATAVDDDLETIFFGNVLFAFIMAVLAALVYYGFNAVAPGELSIPFPILLALLTGAASLVPLVVGKLVYVPLVAYLAVVAVQTGGGALIYPVGLLGVSFLVLDILPQTFIQPYVAGRQIHVGVMMFAYLLGPLLFGWYGFFLLPVFVILVLQAVRIVLTDLLHGDPVDPAVDAAPTMGGEPGEEDVGEGGESSATGDEAEPASDAEPRGDPDG